MTPDPSDPSSRLSRELLLASFAVLLVPAAATVFLADRGAGWDFLWFLGLLPVLLWSYTFQWRGATASLALTLVTLITAQAGAAARSLPPSPILAEIVVTLLGVGIALALLMDRIQRDRGSLEEVALTDRLTALPNRRHARVFLETMFGAAERGRPVSVVLFDLDGFRGYNDRMGSRDGDEALRAFANLLATSTRRMNLSARLGGEEFMSILSGADEEGARAFADRVRETFRLSRPASRELTVSAGVASFHPSMRRPDELVGAADLALYRAKEEGGDRVRVFGRDVRSRDAMGTTQPRDTLPAAGVATAPPDESSAPTRDPAEPTDFARPPEEIGSSPPPPHLLPPEDPRFGLGRRVVLIIPEDTDIQLIHPYLVKEGFDVETAREREAALLLLSREADLVILDLQLMGGAAPDFIRAARSRWPATQIITLAEDEGSSRFNQGLVAGVDDALARPVELRALQAALVDALGRRDRNVEELESRAELPIFSESTAETGERLLHRGLMALVRAGELRDPTTRGHALRVSRYAAALLDRVSGAHGIRREGLVHACLVHDVGKLEIPEAILVKNAPLTAEEFGKVRRHPVAGREILRPLTTDPMTLAVASWHHERWDGTGYPDGLAGQVIPLEARIVAIADALDAMTSARAYRTGLRWEEAVRQIRERFGSHYDPDLAEAFQRAQPELLRIYREAWGGGS